MLAVFHRAGRGGDGRRAHAAITATRQIHSQSPLATATSDLSARALADERAFSRRLLSLREELEDGRRLPTHERDYERFFAVRETLGRGIRVAVRREAVEEAKRDLGYFALMSNAVRNPWTAFDVYRSKDLVEKAFEDLKNRLNSKRALVSSEQGLSGKLLVELVTLIVMPETKRRMKEAGLFGTYTMNEVFDELDVIECFERKGKRLRLGEVTKKQRGIYEALGVTTPSSLWVPGNAGYIPFGIRRFLN